MTLNELDDLFPIDYVYGTYKFRMKLDGYVRNEYGGCQVVGIEIDWENRNFSVWVKTEE